MTPQAAAIPSNAHTHTNHSDGANTMREMAEQALALGLTGLGFSDHSPVAFDDSCPGIQDEAAYQREAAALRQEYAGRLSILCGIEQDFYGPVNREEYDYIIGSVHYMKAADGYYIIADGDAEEMVETCQKYYGGNGLALARHYYETMVENARQYKPDIIGHYDVITKVNGETGLFDEASKAYRDIALGALDAVCDTIKPYGGIVELNTGGVARGYSSEPFPASFLLRHLAQRRVRVMVNSDSHKKDTLTCAFGESLALLERCGFTELAVLQNGRFTDTKI